jgi:hypothetical protein
VTGSQLENNIPGSGTRQGNGHGGPSAAQQQAGGAAGSPSEPPAAGQSERESRPNASDAGGGASTQEPKSSILRPSEVSPSSNQPAPGNEATPPTSVGLAPASGGGSRDAVERGEGDLEEEKGEEKPAAEGRAPAAGQTTEGVVGGQGAPAGLGGAGLQPLPPRVGLLL